MANDSLKTLMSQLQFQRMQRNQMRRGSGNSMSSMLSMINNIGRGQERTVEAIRDNAIASQDIDSINVAQNKIREIGKNAPFTYKGIINEYANSLDLEKKQIQADEDYKNEQEDLEAALKSISPKGGEYSSQIGDVLATMSKNHEINQEFVSQKVRDIVGGRIDDHKKRTAAQMYALSMDADPDTPSVIDAPEDANQFQRAQIEGLNTLWETSQVTGNYAPFIKQYENVGVSPKERNTDYASDEDSEVNPVNLRGFINKTKANMSNIYAELDVRFDESRDPNLHDQYVGNFPKISNYMTSSASGELTHFAAPEFLQAIDMHLIRLGAQPGEISSSQRKARLTEPSILIKDPLSDEKRKRMNDYITSLTSSNNFNQIDKRRQMAILDLIRVRKQLIGAIDSNFFSGVSDIEKKQAGVSTHRRRRSGR